MTGAQGMQLVYFPRRVTSDSLRGDATASFGRALLSRIGFHGDDEEMEAGLTYEKALADAAVR